MIEVKNISKKYKGNSPLVIKDVSFSLEKGEIVGLIGRNGAGKSTLLKMISKFLKPDEGKIFINDQEIFKDSNFLKNVGIHLEPVFFPYLTAYENMAHYLKINNNDEYMYQIEEVLELVELEKHINEKPSSFSFGMKQRLGLAIAMLGDPELLILDEPFVGLDPNGVQRLIDSLKARVKEKGMSSIISSHQLYELSSITDRVLVLNNSEIVFDGKYDKDTEINIVLDRNYEGNSDENIKVENNKIITTYKGEKLNDLIKNLVNSYKIIDIDPSKSKLEEFFWG